MSAPWNFELYIDGTWTGGEGGEIEVIDPATEDVIGTVPEASTKDAMRAVEAARRAFDEGTWAWTKPSERAAALVRMAESLESKAAELRELIVAQTGSAGFITDFIQASGSIGMFRSNAALTEHVVQWVESGAPSGGLTGMSGSAVVREPVGVVAAITPFNFPFMLNVVKVAPALAAGCTVVLKPHPWTPLDAFLIAQAAEEAGLPKGVVNVITGHGDVGDELTSTPLVDMVAFTGSTATGRRIMANGAPTMKRLQLELGGKSAQVLLDDVGEDFARSVGFGQVTTHCGQGCVLQTRLLLPEHLLDAYREGVAAAVPMIKVGDPRDPSTVMGPLIREQQRARVEGYVQSGHEQGAELVAGGKRPDGFDKGFFYEPTVFIGSNEMRIAQEEIFGPVLTVIPYSGKDEDAIRLANDSVYGLGGAVHAENTSRAFNVARQIRAGSMMAIGTGGTAHGSGKGAGQGPGWGNIMRGIGQEGAFGGYKQSGLGREWGHHGIEEFTEIKSINWM
ncbi:MAG TPA: aldehyde dehydrogenase family protein [Acidimicrobiales bacterium]|jgi:acyl-CoA reductase-like NAD-dependent aldehyde dehydrogenase|nr:aldehyde dehydrogenase family protein [Acidimicrobiales bacterium]